MPTVTSFGFAALTNIGPLTSVYTPPAACSTIPVEPFVGTAIDDGFKPGAYVFCTRQNRQDCFPSGKARAEALKHAVGEVHPVLPYYSPAHQCPSGWTTVGALAPKTGTSGIFTTKDGQDGPHGMAEFANSVLAPDETMLLCCPKSYTVNGVFDCTSAMGTLGAFPASYSSFCSTEFQSHRLDLKTTAIATLPTATVTLVRYIPTPLSSSRVPITGGDFDLAPEFPPSTSLPPSAYTVYDSIEPIVLIHRNGDSVKDGKDKGDAAMARPNPWVYITMPFIVAGVGAVAGMFA